MRIFSHQREVFRALQDTARAFFEGRWVNLPHRPRFTRLVAGATGCGKTHLVREPAKSLGLPLLHLCASSWIPLGAVRRGADLTWCQIKAFCTANSRGILFVDEIEKIRGDSTWLDATRPELFFLLDGSAPDAVLYHTEDGEEIDMAAVEMIQRRLSNGMLVVGAGAFQEHWDERKSCVVGFHDQVPRDRENLSQAEIAKVIPAEIANRFVAPVLCLPSLRRSDYEAMLAETVAELPANLGECVLREAETSIEEAIRNGQGARWIQQLVLHALIESSDAPVPPTAIRVKPTL